MIPREAVADEALRRIGKVRCDGFGCDESHPLDHDLLGEPSFGTGRWLGWVYVDLNRPDLWDRPLRFCGVRCLEHWLGNTILRHGRRMADTLDEALRDPNNEVLRKRAQKERLSG